MHATNTLNKRQALIAASATLLLAGTGRLQAQTSEATRYTKDEAVEVLLNGNWIAGTYMAYIPMPNTPHQASFKSASVSGSKFFAASEIRKPGGVVAALPAAAPAPVPAPAPAPVAAPAPAPAPGPAVPRVPMPKTAAETAALEAAIIQEINTLRANPAAWAARLEALKVVTSNGKAYIEVPGEGNVYVGTSAAPYQADLAEAVKALKNVAGVPARAVPPLSPLAKNDLLRKASDLLASDAGQVNGHKDSQGRDPFTRAGVVGYKFRMLNECVASGMRTAFSTVMQLVVDHNVAGRGHRTNLVANNVTEIGVAVKYWPAAGDMSEYLRIVIIEGTPA